MLLQNLNVSIIGVLENMAMNPSSCIREKVEKLGVRFTGMINYDSELEQALGNVERLMKTRFTETISLMLPLISS